MVKKILFLMTLSFGIILPTMAQNVPSYVPTNGLVGWWPFNGNANDESGNGNNGTVNGATLTADRNGKANSAYSFDGINQFIEVVYNSKFNTFPLSINTWIKTNSLQRGVIVSRYENCSNNGYAITSNSGYLSTYYYSENQSYINTDTYPLLKINDNSWKMITIVFNKESVYIYNNSKLIDQKTFSKASPNSPTTVTNLFFGQMLKGICQEQKPLFFNGQIDDIAIYNRAISDQEITNLYKGCAKETATLNPTNGVVLKNASPITLSASPAGGVFAGEAIANGQFAPAKANLGTNTVNYLFTNSTGCQDTTQFKVMVYDTLGNVCSSTDTLKIKVKLTTGVYSNQTTNLSVYPNPTSDVLIIDASDIKTLSGYSYRILDIQGKEVYKAVVSNAKTEISLKTIGAKGVYILHILDANNTSIENKKIVLE